MRLTAVACLALAVSAHAVNVDLGLEPGTTSGVQAGDIVRLDLMARSDPTGQEVTGVQALMQYDDTALQIVDSLGAPATSIQEAPGWDFVLRNETFSDDEITGAGIYFVAQIVTSPPKQTDFMAASLWVKALTDFDQTVVDLLYGPITCQSERRESKVANGPFDITGELHDAVILGPSDDLVPEPMTLSLVGVGLGAIGVRRKRSRA